MFGLKCSVWEWSLPLYIFIEVFGLKRSVAAKVVDHTRPHSIILLHFKLYALQVWSTNGFIQLGQHVGHTDSVTSMALDLNMLFSGAA